MKNIIDKNGQEHRFVTYKEAEKINVICSRAPCRHCSLDYLDAAECSDRNKCGGGIYIIVTTPRTHPATPDPRTGWTKEQLKIGDRVLIEGEVYSTSKLLAYIRINDRWNIEVPISDIKQILP